MIEFWSDQAGRFTIDEYRVLRGAPIAGLFNSRCYEGLKDGEVLPRACHVFSALDQLTPTVLELVRSLSRQLDREPGVRVVNDPAKALFRDALLPELFRRGMNAFTIHVATEWRSVDRFPVFLRGRRDHGGNVSRLLSTREELGRAIAAVRLRGYRLSDLLVVEFCDTVDRQGQFRKYAAFKVGDAVFAAHMMVGRQWMVKSVSHAPSVETALEELTYVESNPHLEWQREVFALAGVDYGRLDFGVLHGRPQAWEINLNPTLGARVGGVPKEIDPEVVPIREKSRELVHSRMRNAFAALAAAEPGGTGVAVCLDRTLLAAAASEVGAARRRERVLASLRGISTSAWLGKPLRALLKRVTMR